MSIFNVFTLMGGIAMFLYGMDLMGKALEQTAGSKLQGILSKMTASPVRGLLLGMVITAVIQSSGATTVMAVGFVNSGLMELHQAIGVIMGANIGTTVTGWLLSLSGLEGDSFAIQMLNPNAWAPILGFIGIFLYMLGKDKDRRSGVGKIMVGFSVLMAGMNTMSTAMSPLADEPWFMDLFLSFKNPVLGVLAGAVLTAVLQSSSASVGILQALTSTGAVTYAAAVPIIMGQNIGTTVTAMLSSIGTNKNARRAAVVHLLFNVIGVVVLLTVFCIVRAAFAPALLDESATMAGIAVTHSVFNVLCTAMLLPAGGLLEKLACRIVPDDSQTQGEKTTELDERLLPTPSLALRQSRAVAREMADCAVRALNNALTALDHNTPELAQSIHDDEELCDHYEDILGTYLVKLSTQKMGRDESEEATELLKTIGDFERISDHAVNILSSAEEMEQKGLTFSGSALNELAILTSAIREILSLSLKSFSSQDVALAQQVEPLEQVIDTLKEQMRTRHILRMQQGHCSIEAGFVLSDLLTDLERTSDHCSNIAGCVIDARAHNLNLHETLRQAKTADGSFQQTYESYVEKYQLPVPSSNV